MSLRDELPSRSLALGTAGFAFGDIAVQDAVDTITDAVAGGVRLIDTARAYTRADEESTAESIVGRALCQLTGDQVLVATKGGHWREGDAFPIDGRPATLRTHCERSLRSLGVPRIDLYFLHHVDPAVPLEESVEALAGLQEDGLIRHIGLSNVSVEQWDRASKVAPISAVQNRLSSTRPVDLVVAEACADRGVVFFAYSPLGGAGAPPPTAAVRVAARRGISPAQVQLAWLWSLSPAIVPIVGATRAATVRDSLQARGVCLGAEDLALLQDATERETSR